MFCRVWSCRISSIRSPVDRCAGCFRRWLRLITLGQTLGCCYSPGSPARLLWVRARKRDRWATGSPVCNVVSMLRGVLHSGRLVLCSLQQ